MIRCARKDWLAKVLLFDRIVFCISRPWPVRLFKVVSRVFRKIVCSNVDFRPISYSFSSRFPLLSGFPDRRGVSCSGTVSCPSPF